MLRVLVATIILLALTAMPRAWAQPPQSGTVAGTRPPQHLIWGDARRVQRPAPDKPDDATAALLKAMGNEQDATTRARALEARLLGSGAFDAEAFLDDWLPLQPAEQQRLAALIPDDANTPLAAAVVAALRADDDYSVLMEMSLPALRAPVEPVLLAQLVSEDASWVDRAWAASALGFMGSEGAVPVLIEGLDAESPDFAYACAEALFQIRPPTFSARWPQLINHPVPNVQWVALIALSNLGGREALETLAKIALGQTDHDANFRVQALNGISYWPMEDSIPILIAALDRERPVQARAMEHLAALTGLDFEEQPELWLQWYQGVSPMEGEDGGAPPLMPVESELLQTVDFVPPGFSAEGL